MTDQLEIDGALCRLKNGLVEYQPRWDDGDLLWDVWMRDPHYDGWTFERLWASSAEEFAPKRLSVEPAFDPSPIGWSPLQIGKATVWASDKLDFSRQIALKYGAAAQ